MIPEVFQEWLTVAYTLDYDISTIRAIQCRHNGNAKQCCEELFKDWLSTNNGSKPKIWQTLLHKLEEIEELCPVTRDIREKLIQMDSQVIWLYNVTTCCIANIYH